MDLIVRASSMVVATVGLILLTGVLMKKDINNALPDTSATSLDGFAVVELFTSQGCSSCPSADRFLSELLLESEEGSKPLYALSFHVDYWDRLGWKDPFSKRSFTDRQRAYAQAFGTSQVYTPQMVINGQEAFVGSQRNQGRSLVEQALSKNAVSSIESLSIKETDAEVIVSSKSSHPGNNLLVNIALVEQDITTKVTRGENGGRDLHHDNVVRVFKSTQMTHDGNSKSSIGLPQKLDRSKSSVIVFIQDKNSMKILAAKSISLTD